MDHKNGRDSNPSFTVKASHDGTSPSFCFACGPKDSFEWIVYQRLGHYPRPDLDRQLRNARPYQDPYLNREHWGGHGVDESALLPFLEKVPRYAVDRGLTREDVRLWEIGLDQSARRMTFAMRDQKGQLVGLTGRAVVDSVVPKYLNYHFDLNSNEFVRWRDAERPEDEYRPFQKSKILYGAHLRDPSLGPPVIVEGQLDAIRVRSAGYNGMSILGSSVSRVQGRVLTKVRKWREPILEMLDNDAAGDKARESLKERVGRSGDIVRVEYPTKDPGKLTAAELRDVLDPHVSRFVTG